MVIFDVRPATSFGSLKTLTKSSIVAVIPARYASSRLPGKVLIDLAGKPMIEHVYERAALVPELDAVIVASDDDRIIRNPSFRHRTSCRSRREIALRHHCQHTGR